jgi:hypothetical protein
MKEYFSKPTNFNRAEFWGVTTLFLILVFAMITQTVQRDVSALYPFNRYGFEKAGIPFNYHRNYFVPQLLRYLFLFSSFLMLSLYVVPRLIRKESIFQMVVFVTLLYAAGGAVLGTIDTYMRNYVLQQYKTEKEAYNAVFQRSYLYGLWLLLLFGFYTAIKYAGIYLLNHMGTLRTRYPFITKGGVIAFIIWMVSMFLVIVTQADLQFVAMWTVVIPFGIYFYWFSLHNLLPKAFRSRKPFKHYTLRCLLILILSLLPVGLLIAIFTNHPDAAVAFTFINASFHLLVTAPLSWFVYKHQIKGNEEILHLKQELGQSNASFDFLRSQINPHFLFNALNTIYGTALEEGAERTSEGVEKLGDMMRFMLQENMQEKIALSREIDYLNNFISLQRLRTDSNPIVKICATIARPVAPVQIAPMLLIPFVENAFKHGISLREPSHINVTLEMKEKTLYFDVYNSKHIRPDFDPEKGKSGIGLNNVRQRLQLLYPSKHELVVRETAKDFFVHLTIQLS